MTELIQLLQTTPGLQVTNSGGEPQITIRGARSLQGENRPLFVLDDVPIGRSYDGANAAIDLPRVESVKVLSPANATRYGVRGQSGVIEIKTKD